MSREVLTPAQCGEMLTAWFSSRCNSSKAKSLAAAAGYKYSFFSPSRKLRLLEEVTFLYLCLAVHGVNLAVAEHHIVQSTVDSFLEHMKVSVLKSLALGDSGFDGRYTKRVGTYFECLRGGCDAIGLAGEFLVGLFGTSEARLKLNGTLALSQEIAASQLSLKHIFERVEVRDEPAPYV